MSRYQLILIGLCCLCNVADGFDVVAMSVAAPVLGKAWNVAPAVMGTVLSAAAVGLTLGAFVIAPLADRFGRRPIMLTAIATLSVTLFLTGFASSMPQLIILRFLTGLGLGAMVVTLNVTVAEFATDALRNTCMAILHLGFTIGMITISGIAALLLKSHGWHSIFFTASAVNALTFIVGLFLIGESPAFLINRRGPRDLGTFNRLRWRMALAPLDELPPPPPAQERQASKIGLLLSAEMRQRTILVWVASLTYAIVGYFLLTWRPTILANAGMSPSLAAASGIITGIFSALGHLTMGLLARRFGEARLTTFAFIMGAITLVVFGSMPPLPLPLILVAGVESFFINMAYTGLFLVSVIMYPASIQNTGMGFMVGFTRLGAVIGPLIGGLLLGIGLDRMQTYVVFSVIALVPALTMFLAARLIAGQHLRSSKPSVATAEAETAGEVA